MYENSANPYFNHKSANSTVSENKLSATLIRYFTGHKIAKFTNRKALCSLSINTREK